MADKYAGNGFGNGRLTFVMEWLWRILTVLVLPVVIYMMAQQTQLAGDVAELNGRIVVLETKTQSMPPVDYRQYLEVRFAEIIKQIDKNTTILTLNQEAIAEMRVELRAHTARQP